MLRPADGPDAADALARGFEDEAAKVAMLPDPALRRIALELSASNQIHAALRHGTAHAAVVDGEFAAVAVWYPPGVSKFSGGAALRAAGALATNATALGRAVPHIASVLSSDAAGALALLRRRRRTVRRASRGMAWYLALLATVPEHRGKGFARSLLDRQLRRCDEDGAAAWLETTDPVNPPIYERFGFKTVAHVEDPAWLPGYWVLRREPRRL